MFLHCQTSHALPAVLYNFTKIQSKLKLFFVVGGWTNPVETYATVKLDHETPGIDRNRDEHWTNIWNHPTNNNYIIMVSFNNP